MKQNITKILAIIHAVLLIILLIVLGTVIKYPGDVTFVLLMFVGFNFVIFAICSSSYFINRIIDNR